MKRLRVGVIGLGPAAEPHAKSLLDLADRVEVIACASRTAERAVRFEARFGLPVTTDIDGLIADDRVEAMLVLTPPSAHLDIAVRCLAAGKHVLVEKPLELSVARGRELTEAAAKAGLKLGVVLQHRFRPGVRRLEKALRAGELGAVVSGALSVPWWRPQAYYDEPGRGTYARDGGGVLLTQAIHALDVFRALVGIREVVAAQAMTSALHRMESEDHVQALVRLGSGAPGSIAATTAAFPGAPERIEIIATKASATLAGGALEIAWHDGRRETVAAEGGTGAGASIMDFPHDAHRDLIADFADAVQTGVEPRVTGRDALATQELIDAMLIAGGFRPTGP